MSEIVCFEKLNGERIVAEVEERGKVYHTIKNPMALYPSGEGKLGFGPTLYSDPQKMSAKLYLTAIATESFLADDIENAYREYVKRLTSSIIQLDPSIKKIQLNG